MTNYITSLNINISGTFCRMRDGNSATRPTVRLQNECTLDMRGGAGVCSRLPYQCDNVTDRIPQLSSFIPRINFQMSMRVPPTVSYGHES
jgi:pyruvate carboxylase